MELSKEGKGKGTFFVLWCSAFSAFFFSASLRLLLKEIEGARGIGLVHGTILLIWIAWLLHKDPWESKVVSGFNWKESLLRASLFIYVVGTLPEFFDAWILILQPGRDSVFFPSWISLGFLLRGVSLVLALSTLGSRQKEPRAVCDAGGNDAWESRILERIADHVREPVVIVGASGRIEYTNRAASSWVDHPPGMVKGMPVIEALSFLEGKDMDAILKALGQGFPGGGKMFPLEFQDNGSDVMVIPLGRRRLGVILKKEVDRLRREANGMEGMSQRADILRFILMELDIPMTGLLGFLNLSLEHPDLPDSLETCLKKGLTEAENLKHILEISRGLGPGPGNERKVFCLNEVLEEEAEFFGSRNYFGVLELEKEYPPEDLPVYGNKERLRLLLFNLLNRACRSAFENGYGIKLKGSRVGIKARIEIAVTSGGDNRGLTERHRDNFFPDRTRDLGLEVSRMIAEEHGGTIECHGPEGFWTTYILELPLAGKKGVKDEYSKGRVLEGTREGDRGREISDA